MAKFIRIFVSERHLLLMRVGAWAFMFIATLGLLGWLGAYQVGETMQAQTRVGVDQLARLRDAVSSALALLKVQATAAPCTPAFRDQLRKVAYLPDGLNEFLYAPGGAAQCSVSVERFASAFDLGKPDITATDAAGLAFWIDRDLGFLGLPGLTGTIELSEPFAVVVPAQNSAAILPPWMSMEVVLVAPNGRSWHRSGRAGIYEGFKAVDESGWSLGRATTFRRFVCDGPGRHCIVAEATLADVLAFHNSLVAMAVVFAALLASWFAGRSNAFIRRYWSLEARFRRHLNADSVVCVYQPIMHLQTGEITGCEVLARWRDIDDTIVLPDKFLAIVERHNLTRQFTRLLAERAFRELSAHLPPDTCLQVNFNIFPRDLDCAVLRDVFGVFDTARDRFQLVLEIVESDALAVDLAQREIDALRRIGIKICIDDFGTGFSNIHNLAALTVDCVKLDRAFAMAPDNSVMALMLGHAIDMIHTSGRTMVVEGVETAERLALLRESTHQVDYVQGYFVSRPLGIERYAEFLTRHAAHRTQDKQAA